MPELAHSPVTQPVLSLPPTSNVNQKNTTVTEDNDSLSSRASLLNVALSGGIGGLIGDSTMYPLDTVKTRQQGAPNELKYRSTTRAFFNLAREEGICRGLYGGYSPAALGSFPATLTFFLVYESSKRLFINDWNIPEPVAHFTSGWLGDFASSIVYVPSEVLKTRLQLQGRYNNPHFYSGYNYKGMIDAARTIARVEGPGALFYGYKATLIRDLPFSALQFAFYEKLHDMAQEHVGHHNDMGVGLELATGAIAGGLSGAITTPLDVVKTRIQTQHNDGGSTSSSGSSTSSNPICPKTPLNTGSSHSTGNTSTTPSASSSKSYSSLSTNTRSASNAPAILTDSISNGLRIIYKTEGIAGLFSGIWPRIVWTSVQSSVMLFVYQTTLKYLEDGSKPAGVVF